MSINKYTFRLRRTNFLAESPREIYIRDFDFNNLHEFRQQLLARLETFLTLINPYLPSREYKNRRYVITETISALQREEAISDVLDTWFETAKEIHSTSLQLFFTNAISALNNFRDLPRPVA